MVLGIVKLIILPTLAWKWLFRYVIPTITVCSWCSHRKQYKVPNWSARVTHIDSFQKALCNRCPVWLSIHSQIIKMCHFGGHLGPIVCLAGISAPKNKYLATPPKFSGDTLPRPPPPPLVGDPPPPPGVFNKELNPSPCLSPRTPPSPPPRRKN